jgi:hypothetical protein
MKIIITENQIDFIRRYKKIKELVDEGIDVLSNDEDFCGFNYSAFIEEVCWQVSDKMEHLNLPTDTVGMIENVHKWVTDNFDEYIRKEFDRVIVDNPNCDEGYDDADDDNLQESYEDKEYDTSLRNALLRRHNVIMSEMDHYMTNNLACDEYPNDVDGFTDHILEEVANEMMFTYNVDNWDWDDLYFSLNDIVGKKIKKTYKSWTKKHC